MSLNYTCRNYLLNLAPIVLKSLLLVLCFLTTKSFSQDPSFSQFTANKLYYNPAFVGINEKIDIHSHYRRYLTRLPAKFESSYFSVDFPFTKGKTFGLGGSGIFFFRNIEGDGVLTTTSIGLPFSVQISDASHKSRSRFIFQFGVTPSIVIKSINWDNLIFSGQLNPLSGYDPSLPRPSYLNSGVENLPVHPDVSFGVYVKYIDDPSSQANVITTVGEFGLAVHHFPTVNHSLTNGYAPLPTKFVGLLKGTFPLFWPRFKSILVQPSVIFEKQATMQTLQFKTLAFNNSLLFGMGLRMDQYKLISFNNYTIEGGFSVFLDARKRNRLWIILSMDLPLQSRYTLVNSSYEISISYKTPFRHPGVCRNYEK